jgi:hypothetical protein
MKATALPNGRALTRLLKNYNFLVPIHHTHNLCFWVCMIMLLFLLLISYALAGPISQYKRFPLFRDPITEDFDIPQSDVCQVGARSITQDAATLNQTIAWEIGEIFSKDGDTYCRTVMRMDYATDWQYAVTEVYWNGHVTTADSTQVAVQLGFNFFKDPRVVRMRLSTFFQPCNR